MGAPPLTDPRWLAPVIALGVRAVAPALDRTDAAPGATIHLHISGPAGGQWWLLREARGWVLSGETPSPAPAATTTVELDAESAARTWYAGRAPQPAAERARITGDAVLGQAVLRARALMV